MIDVTWFYIFLSWFFLIMIALSYRDFLTMSGNWYKYSIIITRAKQLSNTILLFFFSFVWLNWQSTMDGSIKKTILISSTMNIVRFCPYFLIVRYILFFICLSMLIVPWIIATSIFIPIALVGAVIKSSDLFFKKLNPKWIAFTTLFFPTSLSPLIYRSNCSFLSWY